MANASNNPLAVNLTSANSASQNSQLSRTSRVNTRDTSTTRSGRKESFSKALDRATSKVNTSQKPEVKEVTNSENGAESTEAETKNAALDTTNQGEKIREQDAPRKEDKVTNDSNVENVIDEFSEEVVEESVETVIEIIPEKISDDVKIEQPKDGNVKLETSKDIPVNLKDDTSKEVHENVELAELKDVPEDIRSNISENIPDKTNNADDFDDESDVSVRDEVAAVEVRDVNDETPPDIPQRVLSDSIPQNIRTDVPEENIETVKVDEPRIIPRNNEQTDSEDAAPVDEEEIPETPTEQPIQPSFEHQTYFFTSNAEGLLQTRNDFQDTKVVGLMAVVPQSDNNKAQSMLDMLSGKTWTASDVQSSVDAQNNQVQAQPQQQTPVQPTFHHFQPQRQIRRSQIPNQPTANQNQIQPQVQIPNQPTVNQNQPQPQVQVPNQPTANQNQIQPQVQIPNQPTTNQNQIQPQVQIPNQPTANQNQIQPQVQIPNQPTVNQNQPQPQIQFQSQLTVNQIQLQQTQIQEQTQIQPQFFSQEQTIQPQMSFIQPQVDTRSQNQQTMTDLLGVNVQVENNPATTVVTPTQQMPQSQQQSDRDQQQFTQQNFQQNLAAAVESDFRPQQQSSAAEEAFVPNMAAAVDNSTPIQQPAPIQSPDAPTPTARQDFNVPAQIVEQARMIRTAENTEMVINLKPEHLGSMTLRISVNNSGALTANFYTDNAQVRAIIENSLVQLKTELNNQGIRVENVEVYSGLNDGGLTNGQGQQAWQQNQQQQRNARRIDFGAFEDDETESIVQSNDINSTDGVDYKV